MSDWPRFPAPVACLLATALTSGCGTGGRVDGGPTLAAIDPVVIPEASRSLPTTDIDQVVAQYQAVLDVAVEPETRIKVQRRLAGLEMLRSEQRQIDGVQTQRYFEEALALYQSLLNAHPDRVDNDRLLYQMAKAYELDGRLEESLAVLDRLARDYPDSEYVTEAHFRHAELLFSQQRYGAAEQAYTAVVEAGEGSAYFGNAVYMKGWSLFKQSRYQASLASFTLVLDRTLGQRDSVEGLPRAELEMVQDTLRAMSLAFSHLDGARSIYDYYAGQEQRSYLHLLYQQLGELYLEKQRYRDSAGTWMQFVEHYPLSDFAPQFSVRLVEVYRQGGFPSEILPAKQDFVGRYGIHSSYWTGVDEAQRNALRPHLQQYLEELATHRHGTAQLLQQELSASTHNRNGTEYTRKRRLIRENYLAAAAWYAQFADTFPEDQRTPGMVFLMAESLNEAGDLPRAIAAYEKVAYDYGDPERGGEAAYSAILAYERYADGLSGEQQRDWQLQKIESELRFAEVYPGDPRALPVLTRVSEELLQSGNPRDAVSAAARVTAWQPAAGIQLQRTAWLVQGHGNYELADYGAAELAYSSALLYLGDDQGARDSTGDRLAASIYKQAENHLASGEKNQAVDDYLRVAVVVPASSIAVKAHYDGANLLMELQDWERAQQVWQDFRRRYPDDQLVATVPAKLVHIHQQQGRWRQAADELSLMAAAEPDAEVRRQSLYMAAELYEKDGAAELAIERYLDYVGNWPQPFDLATEARYRLSVLYDEQGDTGQRRKWLRELMEVHDGAANSATERSRYLAAMAATVFAEDAHRDFRAASLSLPLKRSLKTKKTLMRASLDASERVLDYGVAEFVTEASYLIGDVYASFGTDLMASDRPGGLNALELEQYDVLLEEQAWPFEEKAIAIHETNARRSWSGVYDQWVRNSIDGLAKLLPARYGKTEKLVRISHDIY